MSPEKTSADSDDSTKGDALGRTVGANSSAYRLECVLE